MLNRDAIFSIDDLPREEVFVSEWNGSVYVRALSGAERDELERMLSKGAASRAAIVALCAVDASGERLFSADDVDALAKKNGRALEKIVTAAMRFAMISDEGIDEGKGD